MKRFSLWLMLFNLLFSMPNAARAQRLQQRLGRGVVVAQNGTAATVTWRRLAQEPEDVQYNVYVDGTKATTTRQTHWRTTTSRVPVGAKVTVSTTDAQGRESAPSVAYQVKAYDMRNIFVSINFEQGGSPLKSADFNTAYVWPIDLDGDGEMDYAVNRKSNTNGQDCYVEGYLRTGEHLWTVKLGPNELSCAGQDDMITAVDMDCDGRGDVVIQSSDGTQFWNPDTKTFGLYVGGSASADTDRDGIVDYETQNVRNAPRYISVIDGMTGREKASVEQTYNQHYNRTNRASLMGDEYNKHVGHMGAFYPDGIHPAVVMEWHQRNTDGSHHYYNLGVGYDFASGRAGQLKVLFNEPTGAPAFHQIRVGDMDGDGRDEMVVGGYTMDHDGSILFNTGISHGDRFRTSDIDPERPGLETFAVQQYAPDMLGQVLYDARTGEFIKKWYLSAVGDIGRGECMDIDKNHLGWEMWSTMDGKVYDAQGNLISDYQNQYPCEGLWWDNEPDREVVQSSDSHYNVYIQDFFKGREVEFAKISGYRYTTVYAKRAAFWGDIIGDWREEMILLHKENGVIVGFVGVTTDYASDQDGIYCLQEDPHYRGDCSTKGYYQSPNPGFYLGYDMPRPPLPPTMQTDLVATSDGQFVVFDRTTSATYADGKSILFDLTFSGSHFSVDSPMSPSVVYAMPVRGQSISLDGEGGLQGNMQLWKGQQGRLILNTPLRHTGGTYVSEGTLEVNGTLAGNLSLRARGTLAGNATVEGNLELEGALNYEGCRLMPGSTADGENALGVITLKKGLNINKRLFAEMDVRSSDQAADLIRVEGDVKLPTTGSLVFSITSQPEAGRYKLLEYTDTLTGSLNRVSVRGLQGLKYEIEHADRALWLVVSEQRHSMADVRWTGAESNRWNYQDMNFLSEGEPTEFVANDGIIVGDDATRTSIQVDELMPVEWIHFENESKAITVNGDGGFTGSGEFVKRGAGRLTLNITKSDYTGPTKIEGGTVVVSELADGGLPSSLGAAPAKVWMEIGKAALVINNTNSSTNRDVVLTDTATIQIANGVASLKGQIRGTNGTLRKTGAGQLNLTYDGANAYKSTILQAGTLAMGTWRSTFGTASSDIAVTGNATITVFNNNSTSQVPTLANSITVDKGKTLTLNAGQRCAIRGKWLGEGTVKINFPYVRGDFSTNLAQYQGIMEVTSGQLRLVANTDLSQGILQLDGGVYAASVKAGSGDETSLTHKIGALRSSATDCTLATGTWNVGYLGTNTTYAGIVGSSATLNKYGDGTLTLSGQSSGKANVNAGELNIVGQMGSVAVNNGGTLVAQKSATAVGTATLTGTLQVKAGGCIVVRGRSNAVDQFKVAGKTTLASPTFVMERTSGAWQSGVDYQVFTGSGTIALSGTPTFEPAIPMDGYKWDYSQLASDGILRIVEDPDAINEIVDGELVNAKWYDLSGRPADRHRKGIVIVDGKKVLKK